MQNRKIFFLISAIGVFLGAFFSGNPIFAEENFSNEITFFYSPTCPHCAEAERFFLSIENKYPEIKINRYEFSKNIDLVQKFYSDYGVSAKEQGFVPLIFTKNKYFVGFNNQIKEDLSRCIEECSTGKKQDKGEVKLPIFGQIDIKKFSFPVLAIMLGFFDGFNVCSLGALVLILGIVISMGSRKKVLLFGGTFILVTIAVYWALIFLWHRLFVFMAPYMRFMEFMIGLLAITGAWYFVKEFIELQKRGPTCKYNSLSDSLGGKLQNVFNEKSGLLMTFFAVFLFAAAVAIIEFPCSAVLPVLFTGILAEANVSFYMSMVYMGIYVLFYMLDEIIVFLIAVFTMKLWIASGKFMKWMSLATGAMMTVVGFYYLIWPFIHNWFN